MRRRKFRWHPIPTTLNEAIERLKDLPNVEDIKRYGEDSVIAHLHHGIGMAIRNEWGLWAGAPICHDIYNRLGITHADDMSGIMLILLHRDLGGRPRNEMSLAQSYKDYWKAHGGMPKPMWLEWVSSPIPKHPKARRPKR